MGITRVALRYANAIIEVSQEQNLADEVYADMQTIQTTIEASQELQDFLSSPIITSIVKKQTLEAIFSSQINAITTRSINLLVENQRIDVLGAVAKQYVLRLDQINGKQEAIVTSAIPLTDALRSKILDKVNALTGKTAILKNIVDPSIIGGYILRIGDIQYNASVKQKFNELKTAFQN